MVVRPRWPPGLRALRRHAAPLRRAGSAGDGLHPAAVVVGGQVDAPRSWSGCWSATACSTRRPGPTSRRGVDTTTRAGTITVADLLAMRDGLAFAEEYEDAETSDVIADAVRRGAGPTWRRSPPTVPWPRRPAPASTTRPAPAWCCRASWPGCSGPAARTGRTSTSGSSARWAWRRPPPRSTTPEHGWPARTSTPRPGTSPGSASSYLRDGVWDGRRLLPEGWVDSGRTPRSVDPDDGHLYGHHWWTRADPFGTFWAAGHDGQFVDVVPALDLVLVRLGRTGSDRAAAVRAWRDDVIDAFA